MFQTQTLLNLFFEPYVGSRVTRQIRVPDKFPMGRETLTAKWVRQNWARVSPDIRNVITKSFPRSAAMGLTEEHLQGFVTRLLTRDDLAPHIRSGQKVLTSVLCAWAKQYVASEIRTWGTDGDARAARQARTPANLRALESGDSAHRSFQSSNETIKRVRVSEDDGGDADVDFVSNDLSPDEIVSIRQTMAVYEKVILEQLSQDHFRAWRMTLEGHTYDEIGQSMGKTHVAGIINEVREVLKEHV